MKISYRTNPIIESLEKGNLYNAKFHVLDQFKLTDTIKNKMLSFVKENKNELLSNVNILTKPFFEAYQNSIEILDKKLGEVLKENVLFDNVGIHILGSKTIIYYFKENDNEVDIKFLLFDKEFLILFYDVTNNEETIYVTNDNAFRRGNDDDARIIKLSLLSQSYMFLFLKYCNIEIKEVGAGKKIKDINCKYVNDTRTNIKVIDSTWFTTLVKNGSFNVRGHFRLQACGIGMKERKLIWISEFEKHGYTRNFKRPVSLDEFNN